VTIGRYRQPHKNTSHILNRITDNNKKGKMKIFDLLFASLAYYTLAVVLQQTK